MSTFKQKKELNSTLARMKAANEKKKGSFSPQQIGRVQYKLNQLAADPKGNAVRSKPKGKQKVGSVIKTGTGGVVRQKPKANLPKKKRIISKGLPKDPKKVGGHPSARPTSKASSKAAPRVTNPNVTTYPLPSAKITRVHDYPKKPTRHPYTKLTTPQLRRKANSGDKRAKAILDIRLGK